MMLVSLHRAMDLMRNGGPQAISSARPGSTGQGGCARAMNVVCLIYRAYMRLAYAAVHVTHKANSALEPRAAKFGGLTARIFRDNLTHERAQ